jgi:hypothetical protein
VVAVLVFSFGHIRKCIEEHEREFNLYQIH